MPSTHRRIWDKFHIKRGDNPPFTGWDGHRDLLAELFGELGYAVGAEVGVQRGKFSAVLCQKNPGLKLKCIDPWAEYFYYHLTSKEKQEAIFAEAQARLAQFNVEFIKKTSIEAAKDFPEGSLDFVYIDGLHDFDNIMMDLIHWSPKVRKGGIVSGHDYCPGYQVGVIAAVDTYTRMHNVNMVYLTREREPSFFWVKE